MIALRVSLNGRDTNPFHKWGLTQNPFSQIGKTELDGHALHLAALGGDPIPNTDYIREHLKGWDPEFVDLCCQAFQKGEYVQFSIRFDV